jgi:Na+-translocating ferredoxin:NAD+ oxidoreductase subunit G
MTATPKKKKNESIPVLIISLCIISIVAAVVLSVFQSITAEPIKQAIINTTLSTFKVLQPDFNNEPITDRVIAEYNDGKWNILKGQTKDLASKPTIVKFYPAKKDGKLVNLFIEGTGPNGYAGSVTALAAVKVDGAVINVDVTQQQETAGLGTNVFSRTVRKTIWGIFRGEYKDAGNKLNPNPIMDFFSGKMYVPNDKYSTADKSNPDVVPASKWKVEKDGGDFKYITGATITSRTVTLAVKNMLEAYYQNKTELLKMFEK